MTLRDLERSRVYAAEDDWALRLDAARQGAVRAEIAGSSLLLPGEVRFGSLEAAQEYVDHHLPADLPHVALRRRRGAAKAHWESPGTIALPVPVHGTPWAMRETVLLHELAHHVAFHRHEELGHGVTYRACMLDLVGQVLGPEAALALRVDYGEHGLG